MSETSIGAEEAQDRIHEFLQKWDEGSAIAWAGGRSLRYEDVASLLGTRPQPTLDREALRLRLQAAKGHRWDEEQTLDAVMELVRPLPTREQAAEALDKAARVNEYGEVSNVYGAADAVLALFTGGKE